MHFQKILVTLYVCPKVSLSRQSIFHIKVLLALFHEEDTSQADDVFSVCENTYDQSPSPSFFVQPLYAVSSTQSPAILLRK